MNLLAPVNRDNFGRPFDPSARTQTDVSGQPDSSSLDPASLLGLFAHIHALGLAQLASGRNSAGQVDGPIMDQRGSASQMPPQALPGGLLGLLAAAPASGSPLLADAAARTANVTTPGTTDVSQAEARARQRYVSGIADQANGGASNPSPGSLARLTNCDDAFRICMVRLPDLRGRAKCDRLKALCDRGIDGIFGSGIAGSNRVE
jgi:hypothetical protein